MTISSVDLEGLATMLNHKTMHREGGNNQRLAKMLGMLTKDKNHPIKANIPNKDRSQFSLEKYKFFLDAPFEISNKCCDVMKKAPIHRYEKESGRVGITAQMASESRLRTQKWLQNGCNAFNAKHKISNPMSFWCEQDILLYIKSRNLSICSVYGDIVEDSSRTSQVAGQITIFDLKGFESMGSFYTEKPLLKTTCCSRTGCVLCGFGCHLEKPGKGRFVKLKEISIYPTIKKDIAVLIDKDITADEIGKVIKKAGGSLLVNYELFDIYGENSSVWNQYRNKRNHSNLTNQYYRLLPYNRN